MTGWCSSFDRLGLRRRDRKAPGILGEAFWRALASGDLIYHGSVSLFRALGGFMMVQNTLVWAGSSMGAGPRQLFWRVSVPAALPTIFTRFRIALPVALIIVVSTEIIGESVGLGYFINFASASFDNAKALAGIVAVAMIGFVLDRSLIWLRTGSCSGNPRA